MKSSINNARFADNQPLLSDLRLFHAVARLSSFVATAAELGASPTFVSKRIAILEKTLGVKLFSRTTRRVAITEQGEAVRQRALKIIDAADGLAEALRGARAEPSGALRIVAEPAFGVRLAPLLAEFGRRHPALELSLDLAERPADPLADAIDIDLRSGEPAGALATAQRVCAGRRIVCGAPAYLARRGLPLSPADLAQHDCLASRAGDSGLATWQLLGPAGVETVKVAGPLATNSADVARAWALAGFGIALLEEREVAADLAAGTLSRLLPAYHQTADVWARCRCAPSESAKIGHCLRFLRERLGEDAAARRAVRPAHR